MVAWGQVFSFSHSMKEMGEKHKRVFDSKSK